MTTKEDNPYDWFFLGADRLKGAQALFKAEGVTYLGIEALHEAVERYLKGYLVSKGETLERTHDLSRLLEQVLPFHPDFERFTQLTDALTQQFWAQHYPGGDLSDVGSDYPVLSKQAEELIDLIVNLIPPLRSS